MVRKAVKELISQYSEGEHKGGFANCPLCQLFAADWNVDLPVVCANCPNIAFYDADSDLGSPCSVRSRKFPVTDWSDICDYDGHYLTAEERIAADAGVIRFWKRVLPVLPTGYKTEFIMTDERKQAIYNIAKQMQDESDKFRDEICCPEVD